MSKSKKIKFKVKAPMFSEKWNNLGKFDYDNVLSDQVKSEIEKQKEKIGLEIDKEIALEMYPDSKHIAFNLESKDASYLVTSEENSDTPNITEIEISNIFDESKGPDKTEEVYLDLEAILSHYNEKEFLDELLSKIEKYKKENKLSKDEIEVLKKLIFIHKENLEVSES